jgi:vitellogenic carboxypeptidase-like protein
LLAFLRAIALVEPAAAVPMLSLLAACFFVAASAAAVHEVTRLPGLAQLAEAQFTGYLPTGTNESSPKLFFWLMESRSIPSKDPVVVWLQGGPGCSGGLGLFWELGPYRVRADKATLYKNTDAWNSIANVLMIDQPAGTGFSSVPHNASIPATLAASTAHLRFALEAFLQLFPAFHGRGEAIRLRAPHALRGVARLLRALCVCVRSSGGCSCAASRRAPFTRGTCRFVAYW